MKGRLDDLPLQSKRSPKEGGITKQEGSRNEKEVKNLLVAVHCPTKKKVFGGGENHYTPQNHYLKNVDVYNYLGGANFLQSHSHSDLSNEWNFLLF